MTGFVQLTVNAKSLFLILSKTGIQNRVQSDFVNWLVLNNSTVMFCNVANETTRFEGIYSQIYKATSLPSNIYISMVCFRFVLYLTVNNCNRCFIIMMHFVKSSFDNSYSAKQNIPFKMTFVSSIKQVQ